ncbi:MAG: hypothetical protein J6T25_00810 [Bacilli bacterium]|nr:hypothetical protein [Bacilli bacterium]
MKYKPSCLALIPLLLTSCNAGTPSKVSFPLRDGERFVVTNEPLTQEEYFYIAERVIDSVSCYSLDFTLSFLSNADGEFNITTTGSWNADKSVGGTFTIKTGKSVWVTASYSESTGLKNTYNLKYLTYDGKLEYGLLLDTSMVYLTTDYSYNPNLPTSYSEDDSSFKTTPKEHKAIELTCDIFNNHGFSFLSPFPAVVNYQNDDVYLEDKPVYSHELTSKHLVLHEKRKALVLPIVSSDEDVRSAYYNSLLGENSDYYLNSTYYYNYRNGKLSKFECSFCVPQGNKTVGTCTVIYKNRHGKEKQEAKSHVKKFLGFRGVERGLDPVE